MKVSHDMAKRGWATSSNEGPAQGPRDPWSTATRSGNDEGPTRRDGHKTLGQDERAHRGEAVDRPLGRPME
eukprot:8324547-Alexandrium_andersonii.AAC.1